MKVCVIGGGSTYTPELIEGLLERCVPVGLAEVHLVDQDEARLRVLGPLAERMARAAAEATGSEPVRIRWGVDRRAAIAGARFVVSQIRVGGMAARERDEQLGREFGLIGQETVGIGGFANALRTIPVALAIAADIADLAPDATLLNFTNPAGLVTEALCRHSAVRTIGLCNVPWTMKARLARAFEVEATDVELDYVGLNHLSWVRGVTVRGEDRTAEALALFAATRAAVPGSSERATDERSWAERATAILGAIPNYYLRYYYDTAAMLHHQQSSPTRASEVAAIEATLLERYADPRLSEKPAELTQRGGAHYSVAAAALMADLVAGTGASHVVDVPNAGAIPGLPDDVVVEVPAFVDSQGAHPLRLAPLRPDVDALLRTVKDAELLTVQAAVDGDDGAALLALVTNPLGPPLSQVEDVWRRLRQLNAGMLGRLG